MRLALTGRNLTITPALRQVVTRRLGKLDRLLHNSILSAQIALQVQNGRTGFLVHSVEGCSFRLRYLLNRPRLAREMGSRGRELVRYEFLLTRHVRDWLVLLLERTGRATRVSASPGT